MVWWKYIHIYIWLRSQTKALNSQQFYSRTQKTAISPNTVDPSRFLSTSGKPYSKVSRTTTKGWPPECYQETKATASPQNKTSSWTVIQLLLKGSFPQQHLWGSGCRSDSRQHQPPSGAYLCSHTCRPLCPPSSKETEKAQSNSTVSKTPPCSIWISFGFVFVYTVT